MTSARLPPTRAASAVARDDFPAVARGHACDDQIVRRTRAAEDDADAAEVLAEGLGLVTVEDADDAPPLRARETPEVADEVALRRDHRARGAEDVAAVDDVGHVSAGSSRQPGASRAGRRGFLRRP